MHDRLELLLEQIDVAYPGSDEGGFAPLEKALAGGGAAEAAWRPSVQLPTIRHMAF